jgi:hypothetical protein
MRDFQISFPALPTDSVRASSPPPYWLPTPFILASSYVPSHPPYPPGTRKGSPALSGHPFPGSRAKSAHPTFHQRAAKCTRLYICRIACASVKQI